MSGSVRLTEKERMKMLANAQDPVMIECERAGIIDLS